MEGVTSPSTEGVLPPMHAKIIHYLSIAIINNCFEFKNDSFKIMRIRYNCEQFGQYHCVKETENFEQQLNFLSDVHKKSKEHEIILRCNLI